VNPERRHPYLGRAFHRFPPRRRKTEDCNFVSLSIAPPCGKDCRRGPSSHALPVSAVCCNEHSGESDSAMSRPMSGCRTGSGPTICGCIPDMR
jgi:hypothetical protein